jgi:hypothetical protein
MRRVQLNRRLTRRWLVRIPSIVDDIAIIGSSEIEEGRPHRSGKSGNSISLIRVYTGISQDGEPMVYELWRSNHATGFSWRKDI